MEGWNVGLFGDHSRMRPLYPDEPPIDALYCDECGAHIPEWSDYAELGGRFPMTLCECCAKQKETEIQWAQEDGEEPEEFLTWYQL